MRTKCQHRDSTSMDLLCGRKKTCLTGDVGTSDVILPFDVQQLSLAFRVERFDSSGISMFLMHTVYGVAQKSKLYTLVDISK